MQAGKVELDLPIEVAGLVVGKKGVTINAIKASSKAHVQLSALPLPDNPKCKRLTISGSSKRDVDDAKDQVVQILASWCGPLWDDAWSTVITRLSHLQNHASSHSRSTRHITRTAPCITGAGPGSLRWNTPAPWNPVLCTWVPSLVRPGCPGCPRCPVTGSRFWFPSTALLQGALCLVPWVPFTSAGCLGALCCARWRP